MSNARKCWPPSVPGRRAISRRPSALDSAPIDRKTPASPLATLSAREREILGYLIEGLTNKEIARRLDLQEITIKIHLRNVYRKIGAINRAQAVRIAMSSGWPTHASP
jgi:DNA-binding CsgD family transcriptional regulator